MSVAVNDRPANQWIRDAYAETWRSDPEIVWLQEKLAPFIPFIRRGLSILKPAIISVSILILVLIGDTTDPGYIPFTVFRALLVLVSLWAK